jgi:hypothetical protein
LPLKIKQISSPFLIYAVDEIEWEKKEKKKTREREREREIRGKHKKTKENIRKVRE